MCCKALNTSAELPSELLWEAKHRSKVIGAPVLVSVSTKIEGAVNCEPTLQRMIDAQHFWAFWGQPSRDFWMAGHGAAVTLNSSGRSRFTHLAKAHRNLLETALISGPNLPGVGPISFGGGRFISGTPTDSPWDSFGDARLIIPSVMITHSPMANWCTKNYLVGDATHADTTLSSVCKGHHEPKHPRKSLTSSRGAGEQLDNWVAIVSKTLKKIESGSLRKVVLAREIPVDLEMPISIKDVIMALSRGNLRCTIFGIGTGSQGFVGATPETLVSLHSNVTTAECLAGTSPRGSTTDEDDQFEMDLLTGLKELSEHRYGVDSVKRSLLKFCPDLDWTSPTILKLPTVQHLRTEFTGTSQQGTHILDLVGGIHPSPVVGGMPWPEAKDVIRKLEPFDRGWFAGPIGIVDRNGDGDFSVAIRSGLIEGHHADLYAGAGIVSQSNPVMEFQETELKLQPMKSALARS